MHFGIENILFLIVLLTAGGLFAYQIRGIRRNIQLGKDKKIGGNNRERIQTMLRVAFGQSKMVTRPIAGFLHVIVYVGFLVINIEVLEIVIDGLMGTHRVLGFLGPIYDGLMAVNEVLGALVILACVTFLFRRHVLKIQRFSGSEMSRWPKLDADIILITEILLMFALYTFNIADVKMAEMNQHDLPGLFPISQALKDLFGSNPGTLIILAKIGWWAHIVGIFTFLNYLPISKHFHIIMAFPNTYFSKLEPKGKFDSVESITHEIRFMLDPSYQVPESNGEQQRFGAKDVTDLSWKNLMDAYTCTECGRCTSVCPANITGKKLSPRKIIMDTRDRLEELKKGGVTNAAEAKKYAEEKGTSLLGDYISAEELWACTTCNACTEACPVNIDHVSEILDLRRYLVLEESSAPQELNAMFTNVENNGAPWAMPSSQRFDWANNIQMPETV